MPKTSRTFETAVGNLTLTEELLPGTGLKRISASITWEHHAELSEWARFFGPEANTVEDATRRKLIELLERDIRRAISQYLEKGFRGTEFLIKEIS